MPEPGVIKTQIVIEDRFSKTFSTLSGNINGVSLVSQNFGNTINATMGNAANSLVSLNNTMYGVVDASRESGSRISEMMNRVTYSFNEAKLLFNDFSDASDVLSRILERTTQRTMTLTDKMNLIVKLYKQLGPNFLPQAMKILTAVDNLKNTASSFFRTSSESLAYLSEQSVDFINNIKPFVKIASRFIPFLKYVVPYLDQIPEILADTSNVLDNIGEGIDKVNIPLVSLYKKFMAVRDFVTSTTGKVIIFTGAFTMLAGAIGVAFLKSEKFRDSIVNLAFEMRKGFFEDVDLIKSKMIYLDMSLQMASKGYAKWRENVDKFGKLDGTYFTIKNAGSTVKEKITKSSFGFNARLQYELLKKKLDELDTELMWHSRTYGKLRNQMMEKGFWRMISYNIKRADVYLINHSETYVKYRKIVNREFNKLEEAYNKNWKNLVTSGRIYISSFKNDLKEAFLVKDIDANGKKTFSFLPSYFYKSIKDLNTYKDLWAKTRDYVSAFYKDLKQTPLGGPLTTLEIYLASIVEKFNELKDKFKEWALSAEIYFASAKRMLKDWWLSARIYFSSATQYVKNNYKDWILSAKIYFSYFRSQFIERMRDAVQVFMLVRKAINYVKFLKFSWDSLSFAKEKVSELIQETEYLHKVKAVYVQFGDEAGREFERFADRASISLGETRDEIFDTGLAFKRMGFSNKSIEDLINFSDRLNDLNPGSSFTGVRDAFVEAFKSGSSEGLAELIGGGRGSKVERQMRKMRLDKFLRKGDVQGFISAFDELANSLGFTQEKADQMDQSIHAKLGMLSANLDRLTEKIKTTIFDKIKPYVEKALDFITSDEFQGAFTRTLRQFSAIIDLVGWFVSGIVDVGLAIYKWWIEPSGEFLRTILGAIALFTVMRKAVAIVGMITLAATGLRLAFNFVRTPIKHITLGLLEARRQAGKFFSSVKHNSAMLSGIASGMVTVFAIASKAIYENVTGESKNMIDSMISIVVGGCTYVGLNIYQSFAKAWNSVLSLTNYVFMKIQDLMQFYVNNMVNVLIAAINPLLGAAQAVSRVVSTATGEDYTIIPELKIPKFELEKLEGLTDEEILQKTNAAIESVGWIGNKVMDLMGLNTQESYLEEWHKMQEGMNDANDHLTHIRKNTKAMDLLWMKELAEQRFVNNVNVRQLTPTVNVKVSGAKITAEDTANAIARELNQMAEAGTFNAYGGYA